MDKRDLIYQAAATTTLTRAELAEALDAILDTITAALAADDNVTIKGFGCFSMKPYPAHEGQNFKTSRRQMLADSRRPVFKPSRSLRQQIEANSAGQEQP